MNLFIIGNGFDLDHGIKTKYIDFRRYLSDRILLNNKFFTDESNLITEIDNFDLPDLRIHCRNIILCEEEKEIICIYKLLIDTVKETNIDWNNFESLLGELKITSLFPKDCSSVEEAGLVSQVISCIPIYFVKWINSIDISVIKSKKQFEDIVNVNEDLFLNFNYTETLEKVYNIKENQICHIHGLRETDTVKLEQKKETTFGKNNSKIIVGFGNENQAVYNIYPNERIRSILRLPYLHLEKSVKDIITDHNPFWDKVKHSNINKIYSYGFSYSAIDLDYIKTTISLLERDGKAVTWYLNDYDKYFKRKKYKKYIRSCGFKGKFGKFTI